MIALFFTNTAKKQFFKLENHIQHQLSNNFDQLIQQPQIANLNIKKLRAPLNGYRLRSGDYRILFTKENATITIYQIAHRKDAY